MNKIALVGPIHPYRGGIAQDNTRLYESLSKNIDTKAYSFKRMYPKFLYPGNEQKEDQQPLNDVDYILDAYSPYSVNKLASIIANDGNEVALINWWTLFWQPGMAYLSWLLRKRGVKTVFICHNVVDHGANSITTKITKFLIKSADGYIVHSTDEAEELSNIVKKPIHNSKYLPVYDFYPKSTKKLKKRGRLDILFFGFVRPYKGLDDLIEAMGILKDSEVFLTIAGEVWGNDDELKTSISEHGLQDNVEVCLRYVTEEEAANYFERADVVGLPYRSATASGVAAVALNYYKPIIGTRVGGLKDIVEEGVTGWLVGPKSPDELAELIKNTSREDAELLRDPIKKFCKQNNWNSFSRNVIEFVVKSIS